MNEQTVVYTKHSLQRARERKLWKYVSKAKFFYEAVHFDNNKALLGNCVYVYTYKGNKTKIITMYHYDRFISRPRI